MEGKVKASDIKTNFWKFIKDQLKVLLKSPLFGSSSAEALDILSTDSLDGSELPLTLTEIDDPQDVLIDVRRTLMYPENPDSCSIWGRLVELANRYHFFIVPRVFDYSVAPALYTMGGTPSLMFMPETEFTAIQDYSLRERHMYGSVAGFEDLTSYSVPFDVAGRRRNSSVHTKAVLPESLLRSFLTKLPSWVYRPYRACSMMAATMGLREHKLIAAGYTIKQPEENTGQTLNQLYNTLEGRAAKAFLQAELSSQRFQDHTVILKSGFMLDFAPGSMIAFGPTGTLSRTGSS
jgi:hypothetical protein